MDDNIWEYPFGDLDDDDDMFFIPPAKASFPLAPDNPRYPWRLCVRESLNFKVEI